MFKQFTNQTSIETLARVELLKRHKSAYSKLLNILRSLTANFSEDVIEIHHDTAEVIIELLKEDKNWNCEAFLIKLFLKVYWMSNKNN